MYAKEKICYILKKQSMKVRIIIMLYSPLVNKVLNFAYEAHHGQKDKSDVPYIFHPYHLAEQMDNEKEVVTALLHDVMEDTDFTVEDIEKLGVGEEVIAALLLLTHDKNVPYLEYVDKLKYNDLARKIKLADLIHNSDVSRCDKDDEYAKKRHEKYALAIKLLVDYENEVNENENK